LPHNGQTGLHWAAIGGHAETVKLLLERGSDPSAVDETYEGTPLAWALYGWSGQVDQGTGDFYATVASLVRAGSELDHGWIQEEGREEIRKRLLSDDKMRDALKGELPN